jgi:hypothetical protein
MRKRIINTDGLDGSTTVAGWLDLEQIAQVELTSEDPAHPIEAALRSEHGVGWRAEDSGPQRIRLAFDQPQLLRRIKLIFHEGEQMRTQEFVLRWSADGGHSYQEVLRQQFTFSPISTTQEIEDYQVNLQGVTVLELQIIPDIAGGSARASLMALHLA